MSQLDRQQARKRALAHRDQLAKLIRESIDMPLQEKLDMMDALTVCWLEAELAMGGPECRP